MAATDLEHQTTWIHGLRGRFVVFDGPDGSGKSTQIRRFSELCERAGVELMHVREPGGTAIGERIRDLLLDPVHAEMDTRCEMLLYMASRAQLVREKIGPALQAGKLIVADRFISSTLAYQGTAGGLAVADIQAVGRIALGEYWPDLVVVLDVDEKTAASRLSPLLDRIESKDAAFHRKVRQGYHDQAAQAPDRYRLIDAAGDANTVFARVLAGVADWLDARPPA